MKSLKLRIAVVLLVLVSSLYVVFTKPITLGLDLKGGTHLVLQVDIEKALQDEVSTALTEIKNRLEEENIPILSAKRSGRNIELLLLDSETLSQAVKVIKDDYGEMFEVVASGSKILLKMKPAYVTKEIDRLAEQALETIRNRVDELGVAEPVIVRNGKDRIIVELPGIKDPERAKKVIGKVAKLEFKEVVDVARTPSELITKLKGTVPQNSVVTVEPSPTGPRFFLVKEGKKEEIDIKSLDGLVKKFGGEVSDDQQVLIQEIKNKEGKTVGYTFFVVKKEPILTGAYLKDAYPSRDEYGMPAVSFELNSEGARIFKAYTSKHIGTRLAIVLDGKVQSAPTIRSAIGARGQIT